MHRAEGQYKVVIRCICSRYSYTPSSGSTTGSDPSISVRVSTMAKCQMDVAQAGPFDISGLGRIVCLDAAPTTRSLGSLSV